eukprot:8453858-Alexandrium_andersonii.AAC.1
MEVFSPPRVIAMAERRPRYGVLPAGALDSRPGPGGGSRGTSICPATARGQSVWLLLASRTC